ncbi:hypothetical protein ACOMHN_011319 [Nucella lapillus]
MFARKGTTVRRGRRSVRRPRASVQGPPPPISSSPAPSSASPRHHRDPDLESGDARTTSPGELSRHRGSNVSAPTVSSTMSLTSCLPVSKGRCGGRMMMCGGVDIVWCY